MHAEPAVAGTALRLLQRPAGPSTGPQPLWVTPPPAWGSHLFHERRIGTELCPQELTPGPCLPGKWGGGGHWSGCVHAAPTRAGFKVRLLPSPTPPSTPSPPLLLSGVQRNYLYICINVYLVTVSLPTLAQSPLHGHSPAPSTLYIMYRKSLCMVEGGGVASESWGTPSPQPPPHRPRSLLKAIPSPRAFGIGREGENASC